MSSIGIINCGPLFFTLPTALSTSQIFNASSGHGLSIINNSLSVAGSSPSHFGQSASARTTGIRSCNSPIALLGAQVIMVQLRISSPLTGDFHRDQRPAITINGLSAAAMAYACFCFPFASSFFPLVKTVSDDQTSLAAFPRVPVCRFSGEFFGAGVES